jgi:peptide/nickel transport system ATP-binding protein/oligopeptide transport system ATP-binding protein
MEKEPLLSVRGLKTYFRGKNTYLKAVDDLSFTVMPGETLGIVGESGSGKSAACMSIPRLIRCPPGEYRGGEIIYDGEDILRMGERRLRDIRGAEIAVIFQEPMTALNPLYTLGNQITEAILLHRKLTRREAADIAASWLERMGLSDPREILRSYPFTLSGGMRQRALIAMALASRPRLLIADEPTTALDMTTQAHILGLLRAMKDEIGASSIYVSHDLGVIREMADTVLVMYGGRNCETAATAEILNRPLHPYTQGLIEARPRGRQSRLPALPGSVPSLEDMPPGCPFHPRCHLAAGPCRRSFPPRYEAGSGHEVYCWRYVAGSGF